MQPPPEAACDQAGLDAGHGDIHEISLPYSAARATAPASCLLALTYPTTHAFLIVSGFQSQHARKLCGASDAGVLQMPTIRFHVVFFLSYIIFVRPLDPSIRV